MLNSSAVLTGEWHVVNNGKDKTHHSKHIIVNTSYFQKSFIEKRKIRQQQIPSNRVRFFVFVFIVRRLFSEIQDDLRLLWYFIHYNRVFLWHVANSLTATRYTSFPNRCCHCNYTVDFLLILASSKFGRNRSIWRLHGSMFLFWMNRVKPSVSVGFPVMR